jgi:putative addiction module component (TIGR02574 family)
MSATEIAKLTLREKFQIMEAIWADLSKQAEQFEIPDDHLQLLDARRARVASGESTLLDWDEVKHSIGRR